MNSLNARLMLTLSISWLGFLVTGLAINQVFAPAAIAILIDRSYCPPAQWQQVSQQYDALYQQHQRQDIQIQAVVLFSSLAKEVRSLPPTPTEIQSLATYGQPNLQQQQQLELDYPNHKVLSCNP